MPKGYAPTAFVSSTCFDLNQVRADMRRFLIDMGFDPILSETPAFPVTPHISPVENCLRAVREKADIFVLIVGARYGSTNETGKSITNLEYLEARAKGIPIFVFVLKEILNILPIWKANPNSDYSSRVDTTKVFEFIETLRSSKNHWVFEFEEVIHITGTLRSQLGYLFMEGLVLLEKVQALKLSEPLLSLSGKSLKLLMERPKGWEFFFFSSVLLDEMARDRQFKWDLQYGLKLASVQKLEDLYVLSQWIIAKYGQIAALVDSWGKLMNIALKEALGKPGEAGDPEHLLYVAQRLARIRKALLEWTIEFNCADTRPECERLLHLISEFSKDSIQKIEGIPGTVDAEISKVLEAERRGEKYEANVMITLANVPNPAEIALEFEKLTKLA